MICRTDITNLKTDIGDKIGQKIIVKGSLGRSKAFEKEATIEKAYPNIFVVKYAENDRNVTYSYTDVLTRTVEVRFRESMVIDIERIILGKRIAIVIERVVFRKEVSEITGLGHQLISDYYIKYKNKYEK